MKPCASHKERKGWVKLHRRILEWRWVNDLPTLRVFLQLLLTASWVDGGTVSASLRELTKAAGLTERQARTALRKLERTGEIRAVHAARRREVFCIANFGKYQATQKTTQKTTQHGGGKTQDSSRENDEREEEGHRKGHRLGHSLSLYEEEQEEV